MRASAGAFAQLFWASDLHFVEEQSLRIPLRMTPDGFQLLRFIVPSRGIRWLRFDPIDASGEVLIRRMQLLRANREVVRAFDADSLRPANQILSVAWEGEVTRLVTLPKASDPFVFVPLGCLDAHSSLEHLAVVTPLAAVLATSALGVLLAAGVAVVGFAAFGTGNVGRALEDGNGSLKLAAFWMSVLFLGVLSAKLLLMRQYPVTVPFWDQWDAEARALYVPFNECGLSWSQMFNLHNEHRIFFTRLIALASVITTGQWDPRLQQVLNAAMHALTAVLVAAVFWIANKRRHIDLLVFAGVLTFAPPFAWENTLVGFQSQFYFLLLFSILSLWLTTRYGAGTPRWCLGWLCAFCSLFSAAGGLILPLVIAGMVGLRMLEDLRKWRDNVLTLAVAGGALLVGVLTMSPPLAHHQVLKARSAMDFAGALSRNLAWPWVDFPPVSLLLWLPMCALLLGAIRRAGRTSAVDRLVIGLGSFVALQACAIAYGRGAGAPLPAPRYQDFLSLGLFANTIALVVNLDRAPRGAKSRRVTKAVLVFWLAFSAVGVNRLATDAIAHLNVWRPYWRAHAVNVRRFVATGDFTEFASKRGPQELPYPNAQILASVLQDPFIRRILPADVRQPVRLRPRLVTNGAFVLDGSYPITPRDPLSAAWGSYTGQGDAALGRYESQIVDPCQLNGYLQFSVAGYLGLPRHSLAVRDLQSGRELEVRPGKLAREDWSKVRVSCPPGPYEIIAIDGRSDNWFAFREPVEVGWASPAAELLIAWSPQLLLVAVAMAVLAARWT
jgi:hypothetical protein